MAETNYYRVLQVDPAAETEVIEAAFRRLAKKYHPDVYQGDDANERMKRLNAAFAILSDPVKRKAYDYDRAQRSKTARPTSGSRRPSGASTQPQGASRSHQEEPPTGNGSGYLLRFGMYAGKELAYVYHEHTSYLSYYLKARMGDIKERNAIRQFLDIPRSEWEQAKPRTDGNASASGGNQGQYNQYTRTPPRQPQKEKQRSLDDYMLRYGTFAGKTLADVHDMDCDYLKSYLARAFGDRDERIAIGRFLGLDPLKVRAEYIRKYVPDQGEAPWSTSTYHPASRSEGNIPWKGILTVFIIGGFFVLAASQSATPSDSKVTTPATKGATSTLLGRTAASTPAPGAPVYAGAPNLPTFAIPSIDSRLLTPVALPTVKPPISPSDIRPPYSPLAGSWVANAPNIGTRFFSVPWWIEKPEYSSNNRYSLGSVSNTESFEAFDVYRFRGVANSDTQRTWQAEYEAYTQISGQYSPALTNGPRAQKAAGFDGNIGQFHYFQASNDLQIDVTLWVGQVNGDRVVMIFRSEPARDVFLDQAVAQILATIDFNAR